MPVFVLLAGATKRDSVQHGNVVANDCCFADHDARRVVDHDAAAKSCRRMNVHCKKIRDAILNEQSHQAPSVGPQKMRNPIGFERVEALEEEKCLRIAVAGGITLINRREIGADCLSHLTIGGESSGENFAQR